MLDQRKVDLLEAYRKRCHDWVRAYVYTHDALNNEINRRRWLTKLWNRGSFCIISLSIFMGMQASLLIRNAVLNKYVQLVLLVSGAILWARYFWSLIEGPEESYLLVADMAEMVDAEGLKPSIPSDCAGSNPVIGTTKV